MRRLRVDVVVFLVGALGISAGCSSTSSSGEDAATGSGGRDAGSEAGRGGAGTGGRGTGGSTGFGGSIGTGGATASGGASGMGGLMTGSGGASATGGSASGGIGGHGGIGGATGGATGIGGVGGATGGATGIGGKAGGGGAPATGGHGGATGGVGGAPVGGASGHGGATGGVGGGGTTGGGGGGVAGAAAGGAGGIGGAGGAGGAGPNDRGAYLVNSVLGCAGCHTPTGGPALSGHDCFVSRGTSCLSSANLTNDDTGLKMFTDQQIKDAIRKGQDPDGSGKYLSSVMPYYQFANLTDADTSAIVAYLRTVPAVVHQVAAPTAPYDVAPTAPEWAPVAPSALPAASTATGPTNGKYLASLVCVTCHTVDATVTAGMPNHIDATKAFQGGLIVTATVNGVAKMVQSANLTPDATGLMGWNVSEIATAITMGTDKNGATICGMRALPNLNSSDAIDIGSYLVSIPPVASTITMMCQ
jgi:hypothetical protein